MLATVAELDNAEPTECWLQWMGSSKLLIRLSKTRFQVRYAGQ